MLRGLMPGGKVKVTGAPGQPVSDFAFSSVAFLVRGAVSMINSCVGMAIDIDKRRPALGNITGGLTGPAIRPLAVYSVFSTFKKIRVPIIGIGGIATWKDAVEFVLAGTSAVAVGT